MRFKRKHILLTHLLVLALVLTSVQTGTVSNAATKAKLVTKKVTVTVGKTAKVTIKNKAKKSSYLFASSNKKIAKVNSKGVVTGVKAGTTKITVTEKTKSKKKVLGKVTVKVVKKKGGTVATTAPATTAPTATASAKPITTATAAPATVAPTATAPAKATATPTAKPSTPSPTPTATPIPPKVTADPATYTLDLSTATLMDGGTDASVLAYDTTAKSLTVSGGAVTNFSVNFPAGKQVVPTEKMNVKITGHYKEPADSTTPGFRVWVTGNVDTCSDVLKAADLYTTHEYDIAIDHDFTIVANDPNHGDVTSADKLQIKAPTFDSKIQDMVITKIEVKFLGNTTVTGPTATPTATTPPAVTATPNPNAIDLSTISGLPTGVTYSSISATQSALTAVSNTDVTPAIKVSNFFIPLPQAATPGAIVKIKIAGHYTSAKTLATDDPLKGFRVWLTGTASDATSTVLDTCSNVLNTTSMNEYKGLNNYDFNISYDFTVLSTVNVTTTVNGAQVTTTYNVKDVNKIQFKAARYDVNIENLVLTNLEVYYQ